MRDRAIRRRLLPVLVGSALLTSAGYALLPGRAAAAGDFEVVNATANAGAAYVVYFTGQFPNFSPGIIGSTFPLTHAHFDNSPFAEGTASPADTGPAGGLVVSNYNTSPPPSPAPQTIAQPQYVDSRYPPGNAKPLVIGNPPGPYATATSNGAGASAQSAGIDTTATQTASSTSTRATQLSRFDTAMSAWRAHWMTPAAQAQHPQATSAAASPDGTDGDSGSSTVSLDPIKGAVVTGDSRVQQASFGGGALVLHAIHTAVTITNSGTPSADIVTTVGDASVGGVPVSIGKDGVVVGSPIVGLDQVQAASQALNAVLNQAGITVGAVAPQIVNSSDEESVTATAVSVTIDEAGPPEQQIVYNLGNIFADDLAVPAQPALPALDTGTLGSGSSLGLGSASSTLTPATTTSETGGTSSAPVPTTVTPPAGVAPTNPAKNRTPKPALRPVSAVAAAKPAWLLAAYMVWQLLIIGTLASLWWWRSSARRLPTPGARP